LDISNHFPIEIISADSRQVYRGMDIGTDKVSNEDQGRVPHRGIDLVNPDKEFTAGQWKAYTEQKIEEIHARGNIPVVVGGTGLYIDMLYRNFAMPELAPQRERRDEMMIKETEHPGRLYEELTRVDPVEAQKHHEQSHRYLIRALEIFTFTGKSKTQRSGEQPVKRPLLMLGLRREKETTNALIDERIDELFARGLVDEVD
jgi:tRNA dimethylallyltransferase